MAFLAEKSGTWGHVLATGFALLFVGVLIIFGPTDLKSYLVALGTSLIGVLLGAGLQTGTTVVQSAPGLTSVVSAHTAVVLPASAVAAPQSAAPVPVPPTGP